MIIKPVKRISGEIAVPGDKSISHRALMIGAIAKGEMEIKNLLDCDDCNYTMAAFKKMGIDIKKRSGLTIVKGNGLRGLKKPRGPIDAGNSGTTMRLLSGILAGQGFETVLTGEKSLRARPMGRIIEPLSVMGAKIKGTPGGYPPLTIQGGNLKPINYILPVASAQVKSAVLFAGLYADGVTYVKEDLKSRDHTERMLKHFEAALEVEGMEIGLTGGRELIPKNVTVPGDVSSASFFMAAAIILNGSRVKIKDVSINPTRAGILDILSRMGAKINITNRRDDFEPTGDIEVASGRTSGVTINREKIPAIIDELPIIFVLAALSRGTTIIKGAGELRVKETDRINSMKENLSRMGADIKIEKDEVIIKGADRLKGSSDLKSFHDHRTCMAVTVAALAAKGNSSIDEVSCVSKSFPGFFKIIREAVL